MEPAGYLDAKHYEFKNEIYLRVSHNHKEDVSWFIFGHRLYNKIEDKTTFELLESLAQDLMFKSLFKATKGN